MTTCIVRRPLATALAVAAIAAAAVGGAGAAPGSPETRELTNGLRAVLLEDHALPVVAVSLWVGAGSKDEIESSAGYAHFLEHLVQRGTDATGPFDYTRRAHRFGGDVSVRSNYDRTYITLSGIPSAVGDMIDAAAAMAFKAALKESEIDLELRTLSQEVHTYYDLPSSVAFLETMRTAFPEHPYRFPMLGNFRTIGTLRTEPLQAFYRNLYVANNMAIAVAGDFDPKTVAARLQSAFGSQPMSATLPPSPPPPATFAGHTDVEKRLEFGESWTTLSFVGPGYRHPDRLAFEVLAAALADSSSPLVQEIQKDKTGTLSQVSYYGLEDAGLLYVALNPGTPELSYNLAAAAMRGLVAFRKNGLAPAALQDLVGRVLRDERLRASTITERAERLGEAGLFGGARYYWDRPTRLSALTPADLARVAARYLVPDNMRLVVLVPKATGVLADAGKAAFHQAADGLGVAGGNPATGFEAGLYTTADAARPDPSSWGSARGAPLPDPTPSRLKNGMSLVILEDHRQPLVGVSLYLHGGSALDPAGREGLAGLTLRLLAGRTAAGMRAAGSSASRRPPVVPEAQAMRDALEIRMIGDPADVEPALIALSRAVQQAPATETEVEAPRRSALFALDRADRDPDVILQDLVHEKVYADHPYAHRPDGTPVGLKAITPDDLAAFAARVVQPDRACLAVVGDVDPGTVARLVNKSFGGWKTIASPAAPPAARADSGKDPAGGGAPRATAGAHPGEYTRLVDAPQSRVMVVVPGVPLLDPEFADLRTLGAGLALLAFEDMVFTQRAAFSAVSIPEGLEQGGALGMQVLSPPARRGEVLFDVQRLMRKLASEELPAADLGDVARMLAGREAMASQGVLAVASALAFRESTGLGARSWREGFAPRETPAARLKSLAERYFRPEAFITVVVGPGSP